MALSFQLFADSALTEPLTSLVATHLVGSGAAVDQRVFFGSAESGVKLVAASDPGVDDILLSVADANPGDGHEPSAVRLATTQGGLDSATPGAALNLGAEVLSGAANAVEVWIRRIDETGTVGISSELSAQTQTVEEQPQ